MNDRLLGIGVVVILLVAGGLMLVLTRAERKATPPTPLPKTDPALIGWREVGKYDTEMQAAHGVAVMDEGTYVICGDGVMQRMHQGRFAERMSVGDPGPFSIVRADEGSFFLGLGDHVCWSSWGRTMDWPSLGKKARITSLARVGTQLWVADAGNKQIVRYQLLYGYRGKKLGTITGFLLPSPHLDVAVAPDGLVWVTHPGKQRVEAYKPDGSYVRAWGRSGTDAAGFAGCCNPTDLAMLPDGRFVTAEKAIPRVKVYRKDGHFQSIVAGHESFARGTDKLDLAVDARGRILVLDGATGIVRIYAEKTKP